MSKASKRAPSVGKHIKSRGVRYALAKQSVHKRAKAQSVKHVPKGRLEEATAELDSQLAHVQALYAVRMCPIVLSELRLNLNGPQRPEANLATGEADSADKSNVSVEGLGDILRGL